MGKYYELHIEGISAAGWGWKHDFPPVYLVPFAESSPTLQCEGDEESDPTYELSLSAEAALGTLARLGLSERYFESTWASFRSWQHQVTLARMNGMVEAMKFAERGLRA